MLTLESVKSNEELDEDGVSTVKTTSKLRPDLASYNCSPRKQLETQVQRFSSIHSRQSTMLTKFKQSKKNTTEERNKISQHFRVNSFQRPFNTTFIT